MLMPEVPVTTDLRAIYAVIPRGRAYVPAGVLKPDVTCMPTGAHVFVGDATTCLCGEDTIDVNPGYWRT